MEESVYFGLMLMVVGMTTVFVILGLVVLGGKLTILLTNRWAPVPQPMPVVRSAAGGIAASKIAAITAVVEVVTGGKGRIKEIKKEK